MPGHFQCGPLLSFRTKRWKLKSVPVLDLDWFVDACACDVSALSIWPVHFLLPSSPTSDALLLRNFFECAQMHVPVIRTVFFGFGLNCKVWRLRPNRQSTLHVHTHRMTARICNWCQTAFRVGREVTMSAMDTKHTV